MVESDLQSATPFELLGYFTQILDELRQRGVVRTRNNPAADYAEWLVAKSLHLSLAPNSKADYDAINESGVRFQIKCRRLDPGNKSTQLGVIRNLEDHGFDYLVGVLFQKDFTVKAAYQIPQDIIQIYARFSKHQNGHLLSLRGKILQDREVENITQVLIKNQRTMS